MRLTRDIYPGLFCGIVILILTGLPGSCFPVVQSFWDWLGPDKVVHVLMFGLFAFSIPFGYRENYGDKDKKQARRLLCCTLSISIVYGGLTELLQKYVFVGRCGSLYDFYADVIGCILGVFIFKMIFRKKIKKNRS